jgi:hypothetical protein
MKSMALFRARLAAPLALVALVASGCDTSNEPTGPVESAATGAARASELQFTGVWVAVGTFEDPLGPPPWQNTPWPAAPPFTEWGKAESQRLDDHANFVACSPPGPVYHMWELGLFPIQILQAPDQIAILRETGGLPRRIYMDGRGHPEDLEPTWQGHSIGLWEGDVLVVDTVGTNGKARAMNGVGSNAQVSTDDQQPRMPASDELHLVERFRLVANGEILEDQMTIVDPKTYTEPIVVKHYFQRRPDIDVLEYYCGENPRPSDEVHGSGGAE